MKSNDTEALHVPKENCNEDRFKKQLDYIHKLPYLKRGMDATNSMILILNHYRQAVFANKAFLMMVNMQDSLELVGKRPCEIIKCIYACDGLNDAETTEACRTCTVINAVLRTMETNEDSAGEFSNITTMNGYEQNLHLSIHVAALEIKDERFSVVSFADNSDSVRRRILERIFFHDIINTAGALKGIVGLLKDEVPEIIKPEVEFVEQSFNSLVEKIQSQKYMMDADNKHFVPNLTAIETLTELQLVSKLYEGHDVALNRTIRLDENCVNKRMYTDQRLLSRILGNMVKNALEASDEGNIVTLGCNMADDHNGWITFWVHNDKYMDERIQNLVFQNSFSTKGAGRGLGTYGMKLFGEKFLKGKVGFFTDKEKGTTFYIKLPLQSVANE